jgi:hypothetical protein
MPDKLPVVRLRTAQPYIVENTLINSERDGAGYNLDSPHLLRKINA